MAAQTEDAAIGGVKLYSAWFCPFAQRAWMVLEEKRAPYELVEIDPYDKTAEFLAVNPRGLVPAIKCANGDCVYESTVCVEFAEDAWRGEGRPALLPASAHGRAVARIWVDFVGRRVVPCFYRILQSQDAADQAKHCAEMLGHVKDISAAMAPDTDFFMGDSLGVVDIALAPFAWRFGVLEHYRQFKLPDTKEYVRFRTWWDAVQRAPSFKATTCDYNKLIAIYERYSNNTAQSGVAQAIRAGSALP
ncbi:unnamed protein product [Ostreobium quekettii]|uniref:Glutathione S-transferase n=1 Tax=Ostreobium quekettii TaxID=121088 RepID=A0A8S1IQK1_9CHLO|nr:unnamed protein product [Ostreobium quekettii]|eukprot:evm.model.scf_822.3 EVM.evm.TU.scf_822.3   scf_822:14609-15891(+)